MIDGLAQGEPLRRRKPLIGATSSMTSAMLRAVSSQRGSAWPAAQDASAMRRRRRGVLAGRGGRRRERARVAGRHLEGGASGTVSAAAPPVVQTIGRPRAIASASTMP